MSGYLQQLKIKIHAPTALQKPQKGGDDIENGLFAVIAVPRVGTFRKSNSDTADQITPSMFTKSEQALADEAECRADFCNRHRELIGGNCPRYNVMNGIELGDRVTALDTCLLWRLVKAGKRIELAGAAEVLSGITVADVMQKIQHPGDQDRVREERRLLLISAER